MNYSRRFFLKKSIATTLTASAFSLIGNNYVIAGKQLLNNNIIDWSNGLPPIYCIAYINPGIESHKNQESEVAKFPLALVPQDDRYYFYDWKEKVKSYNPEIKLLAYQKVIDEALVPGPGHEILRDVKNSWVEYHDGYNPTVTVRKKKYRIYDPRKDEWRKKFIEACEVVLNSYDYEGLFLDQCTIYKKSVFIPSEWNEMFESLESIIKLLRFLYPDKIIIGNSSYSFSGLNGEMNEGRINDLMKETLPYHGHVEPRYELLYYNLNSNDDIIEAERWFRLAIKNKAFFGCGVSHQRITKFPFIDRVLSEHVIAPPPALTDFS